jgi:hypothetical protein
MDKHEDTWRERSTRGERPARRLEDVAIETSGGQQAQARPDLRHHLRASSMRSGDQRRLAFARQAGPLPHLILRSQPPKEVYRIIGRRAASRVLGRGEVCSGGQGRAWLRRPWHARCTPSTCRSCCAAANWCCANFDRPPVPGYPCRSAGKRTVAESPEDLSQVMLNYDAWTRTVPPGFC